MVKGQAKGSSYERDLSRAMSLWITKGERDDTVWRSNASGAQFTQRRKKVDAKGDYASQAGDLCSIHPLSEPFFSKFSVEAKRYRDLSFENLIFQKTAKKSAQDFWETHVKLSKQAKKVPLCIFKQDRQPDILLLPVSLEKKLKNVKGVSIPWIGAVAYVMDDFLANVQADILLTYV